ncbi:MAG: ABC transporter permease [Candidatus Micrarchaeia archaeon]
MMAQMAKHTFAIFEKEIKLDLRYKVSFFLSSIITPILSFAVVFVVYHGFFSSGGSNVSEVTRGNYTAFLLIGALTYTVFNTSVNAFHLRFLAEKWWLTINAMMIAPVSRFSIIFGVGAAQMVRSLSGVLLIFLLAYLFHPVSPATVALVTLILFLIACGCLGFGLVRGVFAISNEDALVFFDYFVMGWVFLSCFHYPKSIIPPILDPLVILNPVYHGVTLMRILWFGGSSPHLFLHWLAIILFAIISPIVGVIAFNFIWNRMGSEGY